MISQICHCLMLQESVDLEDMDEAEAKRVDTALSQAFKTIKPTKNKKQPSHAKALTHFRIRYKKISQLIHCFVLQKSVDLEGLIGVVSITPMTSNDEKWYTPQEQFYAQTVVGKNDLG